MEYYGTNFWAPTNTLSHHGIKGQKWGKRNGPPYPLKPSDHSPAEKKASSGRSSGSGESYAKKLLKKYGKNDKVGMDPITAYYLTEAAAFVAIFAAVRISQEVTYSKDKKEHMNSDVGDIQKKIKGKHTEDQDMAEVNKGYSDADNLGTHMNCALCSATYDLRRRGYDVKARETKQGRKSKDIAAYYGIEKKDINKYNNYNKLVDALRNEPDGSRGFTMSGAGMFDSLHCMVWEKSDGKVIIRDAQSNTKYNSLAESCINKNSRYNYEYIRTDNREVNWDLIKDAVEERKD